MTFFFVHCFDFNSEEKFERNENVTNHFQKKVITKNSD